MGAKVRPKNFHGVKGKGRGTIEQEIAGVKQQVIKEATTEALVALAKTHLYKQLEKGALTYQEIKELGLPIVLKDMITKNDITTLGKEFGVIYLPTKKNEDTLESDGKTETSLGKE